MELRAQLEPDAAWREIRGELRSAVGDSTFELWLDALQLDSCQGTTLTLQAPSSTQAWVAKRFAGVIESCARSVVGEDARIGFTTTDALTTSRAHRPDGSEALDPTGGLNPRYSFNQFIIGDGNRLAHAAALAVAELPGQAYNPLFIHAPPGLGKTHLLHAIGNYVLAFGGGATVRYTTVEAFTNHFLGALATKSVTAFKRAYRDADVLLIDDVQFLASKAKTSEEFFHTFNALYENGRQLVLTCDVLPRQLVDVEERLRERFESGLVADIEPPDFSTRLTILRKRARLDGLELARNEILELIAERVTDNVRALEGALIRIVAHHSLSGRPIDVELATDVLDSMFPSCKRRGVDVNRIQEAVAGFYDVSTDDLLSPSRAARVTWPRQLAIHLARELTEASLPAIGAAFGGRNHATIIHACKRVSERMHASPEAERDVQALRKIVLGDQPDRPS